MGPFSMTWFNKMKEIFRKLLKTTNWNTYHALFQTLLDSSQCGIHRCCNHGFTYMYISCCNIYYNIWTKSAPSTSWQQRWSFATSCNHRSGVPASIKSSVSELLNYIAVSWRRISPFNACLSALFSVLFSTLNWIEHILLYIRIQKDWIQVLTT